VEIVGGGASRDRTRLGSKFPANTQKAGNFHDFGLYVAVGGQIGVVIP
jgi:hypothetical protein